LCILLHAEVCDFTRHCYYFSYDTLTVDFGQFHRVVINKQLKACFPEVGLS